MHDEIGPGDEEGKASARQRLAAVYMVPVGDGLSKVQVECRNHSDLNLALCILCRSAADEGNPDETMRAAAKALLDSVFGPEGMAKPVKRIQSTGGDG